MTNKFQVLLHITEETDMEFEGEYNEWLPAFKSAHTEYLNDTIGISGYTIINPDSSEYKKVRPSK